MSKLHEMPGGLPTGLPERIDILLVEDDEDDYLITRKKLQAIDTKLYQLEWLDNWQDGLKAAITAKHHVIVCDYRLGSQNGLDLLREIRAAGVDTPLILLTGRGDRDVDLAAMQSGVTEYIDKTEATGPVLERSIRYAVQRGMTLRELRASEARYQRAVVGANDGIWEWNLDTNMVYYSPRWQSLLGTQPDSLSNSPNEWLDRVHADDRLGLEQALERHLATEGNEHLEYEHRLQHESGHWLWCMVRAQVSPENDHQPRHLAGSLSDISRRKTTEAQLLHDALHDPLTNLPNRALFTDRLNVALKRTRRNTQHRFGVLVLDLDRFKVVNDSLGHVAGDRLLIEIANRLPRRVPAADTIARLGGDEFAIIVEDLSNVATLVDLAAQLLEAVAEPLKLDDQPIAVTASIGITVVCNRYTKTDQILRDADMAMYRAKQHGRNRYEIFDSSMHETILDELKIVADLRHAIEDGQLCLHYQPVIRLNDEKMVGMEALLRWDRPDHEQVQPDEFIRIAEENNLIGPISEWVIKQALHDLAQLHRAGEALPNLPYVCVNLSAMNFRDLELPNLISEALESSGAPANKLLIEVTETTLMEQRAAAYIVLNHVRELGARVSIDDFGTGYSSLTYLHQFPFDVIKIDRSFVGAVEEERRSLAIIRSVIALAKGLGLEVISEGIETRLQQRILQIEGCQFGQGFLFAKPMPFAELEKFMLTSVSELSAKQ